MTPYGYTIERGRAQICPAEQKRLTAFYQNFLSGMPILESARRAGIPHCAHTCKRMLHNSVYLGTDYYPPLIPRLLYVQALRELKRRSGCRKKRKKASPSLPTPVYTRFLARKERKEAFEDSALSPRERAALQYQRILPME